VNTVICEHCHSDPAVAGEGSRPEI
jgi:hypothetical protein